MIAIPWSFTVAEDKGRKDVHYGVPIVLDKPRTLRFDYRALRTIERRLGVEIKELPTLDMDKPEVLRTLLWAGLRHEDHRLTFKHLKKLTSTGRTSRFHEPIGRALLLALECDTSGENHHGR